MKRKILSLIKEIDKSIWSEIPGYEGRYWITKDGAIASIARGKFKIKAPYTDDHGYLRVCLSLNGKRQRPVHQLVLETFVGMRPDGYETSHLNGKRDDPRISNLKWDTRTGNARMKKVHGAQPHLKGESSGMAKLKDKDVVEIRKLVKSGTRRMELAERFKVGVTTIDAVITRQNWGHI